MSSPIPNFEDKSTPSGERDSSRLIPPAKDKVVSSSGATGISSATGATGSQPEQYANERGGQAAGNQQSLENRVLKDSTSTSKVIDLTCLPKDALDILRVGLPVQGAHNHANSQPNSAALDPVLSVTEVLTSAANEIREMEKLLDPSHELLRKIQQNRKVQADALSRIKAIKKELTTLGSLPKQSSGLQKHTELPKPKFTSELQKQYRSEPRTSSRDIKERPSPPKRITADAGGPSARSTSSSIVM